ncbi:MAG: M3 family metallopeptidase, partial [Betaproteobacteria bacterium]
MSNTNTLPNPLLDTTGLPLFDQISAPHVEPAMDILLQQAQAALEAAVSASTPATYDAVSAVLDVANERLGRAWGAVNHLNAVADTPELRAAYNACLPKVTEFKTRMGADERLYAKYKAIAQAPQAAQLNPARRTVLEHALRDFVLSGAELQGAAKQRFAAIQERLAELSQRFSENVLDATDGFTHYASEADLAGVPEDVVQAARAAAIAEGREGHKITLHYPSYFPVMQYAHNRTLRETLYRAYTTRASEFGPAERDNSGLMQELLSLRQEEARLLGFANYAQVSLAPKMAQSPQEVLHFLRDLAGRARPYAQQDMAELREFAARHLDLHDLQAWDQAYVSERLKEARYAFSEQDVKRYFTEDRVLSGLFKIIE